MKNDMAGSKVEVVRGVPVSAITDIKIAPETETKVASILEESSIENIFLMAFGGNSVSADN